MWGKFGGRLLKISLKQQGFTLLELLAVTLILSILLTAVTLNYAGVQEEATDNLVQADLHVIAAALNFYRLKNQKYPVELKTLETRGYLEELPDDKFRMNQPYLYQVKAGAATYLLWSVGANGQDDHGGADDIVLGKQ